MSSEVFAKISKYLALQLLLSQCLDDAIGFARGKEFYLKSLQGTVEKISSDRRESFSFQPKALI